ncbi:MAG: hypothetical protein AB7I38_08655 [Dehalococcoidia bacterium]
MRRWHQTVRWIVLASVLSSVLVAACGSDDPDTTESLPDGPAGTTAPGVAAATATATATRQSSVPVGAVRTDFSLGTCEATVSGGVTATMRSGGDQGAVASEYWLTEEEVLQAARQLNEDPVAAQAKLAAGEFVFYPLVLNCGDSRTGIVFLPSATTHEQFPFGPGSYSIAAIAGGTRPPDGEVGASVTLSGTTYRATGGRFEVTRFDHELFAGTFRFDVEEQRVTANPRRATIEGHFEMKCTGGTGGGGCAP